MRASIRLAVRLSGCRRAAGSDAREVEFHRVFCRSTHSGAELPEALGLYEKLGADDLQEGQPCPVRPDQILKKEALVFVRPDPRRA